MLRKPRDRALARVLGLTPRAEDPASQVKGVNPIPYGDGEWNRPQLVPPPVSGEDRMQFS